MEVSLVAATMLFVIYALYFSSKHMPFDLVLLDRQLTLGKTGNIVERNPLVGLGLAAGNP